MVECLLCKSEALNSDPNPTQKNKKCLCSWKEAKKISNKSHRNSSHKNILVWMKRQNGNHSGQLTTRKYEASHSRECGGTVVRGNRTCTWESASATV
jgi:hypothetical protein